MEINKQLFVVKTLDTQVYQIEEKVLAESEADALSIAQGKDRFGRDSKLVSQTQKITVASTVQA